MKYIDQNRCKIHSLDVIGPIKKDLERFNVYSSPSVAQQLGYHGDKAKNRTPKLLLFHCCMTES